MGGAMNRPPCQRGLAAGKARRLGIALLSPAVPGSLRRLGDCLERSSRSRKWHFKIEKFLRHVASLKRQLAVRQSLRHVASFKRQLAVRQSLRHAASLKWQSAARQSLRHGLRPCHLPLTREAERLRPPIGPLVKGGWLRALPADWGIVLLSPAVPGSLRRLENCTAYG